MPSMPGIPSYKPVRSYLPIREHEGKKYFTLKLWNATFSLILKWIHGRSKENPLAYPFYPLKEYSFKDRSLILQVPKDHKDYKTLKVQLKAHSNPTEKEHDSSKEPLHLDGIMSIIGQVAAGMDLAEQRQVLLKISADGIVAKKSRTEGSQFSEWDVFINDFSKASIENDAKTVVEVTDRHNQSPEESKGSVATRYSERYRLGILLYTLLTRQNPFEYFEKRYDLSRVREDRRVDNIAERLFWRVSEENDELLTERLEKEPEFARKEIYLLLKGLLNIKPEMRTGPKEVAESAGWLEKMYISHIDNILVGEQKELEIDNEAAGSSLGRGGMASVYEMRWKRDGSGFYEIPGALKINTHQGVPHLRDLFHSEVDITTSLVGKANIVTAASNPGFHPEEKLGMKKYYNTLADEERFGQITSVERLYDIFVVFTRIAETMQELHEKGIVHRDLKPPNFLFANASWDPGAVVIGDFGLAVNILPKTEVDIARLEQQKRDQDSGIVKGTPFYIAPEALRAGGILTTKSDVYSLALVLYETLCGKRYGGIKFDNELEYWGRVFKGEIVRDVIESAERGGIFNGVARLAEDRDVLTELTDNLADLFGDALHVNQEFRCDMEQFAELTRQTAEILNKKYNIEQNRQLTRRRLFA